MAGEVIKVGDGVMNPDEALKLADGFEPLHDPLSSPGWLMLILGAIVEPLVLTRVHQLNSIFAIFRVSDHDKALVLKSRCL